jgi:hypothetical protein
MTHQLTDQKVRRVLECLRDFRRKTLEEIIQEYNQRYPPSRIGKLIGLKISEQDIKAPLRLLEAEQYVKKHIMFFTDEPHPIPVIQYGLTNAGFQYLSSLK